MNLLESIYVRKSIRHFKEDKIEEEALSRIEDYIKNIVPLYSEIKTDFYITRSKEENKGIKGMYKIDSPYYILFYSDKTNNNLTNIGFITEQLSLYLTTIGIGSCFLGMSKPKKENSKKSNLDFITMLSIGYPASSLTRTLDKFKRKNIEEISNDTSSISEVVRLAPSGMNLQPWRIYKEKENIYHMYCIKTMFPSMNKIDIGIALSHIYVYAIQNNLDIKFLELEHPIMNDMDYQISAVLPIQKFI